MPAPLRDSVPPVDGLPLTRSVVFYISGHGFGHASRDVEVINAFVDQGAPEHIVIRSAVSASLLERTLKTPFRLLPGPCDTGIIQTSSISNDDAATLDAALDFHETFDARVTSELTMLAGEPVSLVVSDIAPIAFHVAERLGVPGVALGNFTWDWVYETHPQFLPRGAGVIDLITAGYRMADLALRLPMAAGFEVFREVRQLPLVARHATRTRRDTRSHFGVPHTGRMALLSFGGYGMPALDLAAVDCAPDWTIVTTDRVTTAGGTVPGHVRLVDERAFIDTGFRYEDLVAAADVVITKPGYGIIAECAAAGTPMVYTSRGHFREYDLLVEELPRLVRGRFVSQEDLFAGRWRAALEGVLQQADPPRATTTNGAQVAADWLAEVSRASSSR